MASRATKAGAINEAGIRLISARELAEVARLATASGALWGAAFRAARGASFITGAGGAQTSASHSGASMPDSPVAK